MSFEIVRAETRTARMIEWFSGICSTITDFVVGSKIRCKLETVAVEMESQDYEFYQAIKKAIPIAIYQAFDFNLEPAAKASGYVTFQAANVATVPIVIPAGTVVAVPATAISAAVTYRTTTAATLRAGQNKVAVQVICDTAGVIGNAVAGAISEMQTSISEISTVRNTTAFTTGAERETEAHRKLRFQQYIATLVRGTDTAIEYGASSATVLDNDGNIVERVLLAKVLEPYRTDDTVAIGHIYCYIYNGIGNTSDDLINNAQKIINGYDTNGVKTVGYKSAGVICSVLPVVEVPITINCAVTVAAESTDAEKQNALDAAEAAINAIFPALTLGDTLHISTIIHAVMSVESVHNVYVLSPLEDINVLETQVMIPGNITVKVY